MRRNKPLFTESATILGVINESIESSELKIKPDMPGYDTALFGALLKNIQICIKNYTYERMGSYIMLFQYILQKVSPNVKQNYATVIEKCLEEISKNAEKGVIPQKYMISMYYNMLQFKPPVEWYCEKIHFFPPNILIGRRNQPKRCLTTSWNPLIVKKWPSVKRPPSASPPLLK